MKKRVVSAMLVLTMAMSLMSCGKKDEEVPAADVEDTSAVAE